MIRYMKRVVMDFVEKGYRGIKLKIIVVCYLLIDEIYVIFVFFFEV